MTQMLQYVDSTYLCFQIPHQAVSLTRGIQNFPKCLYLNAKEGSLCLEDLPSTIWTIRPFNESSFYIEVTLIFDSSPLYLSITKTDRFMLTSYATDSTLFCEDQGINGRVLKTASSKGNIFFLAIEENVPGCTGESQKYYPCPSNDALLALTFSFVRDSKCQEPIVSLDSIPYIQRCEEYFLRKPVIRLASTFDESGWLSQSLQYPRSELVHDSYFNEGGLWTAKESIRSGTVFCSQQSVLFGQLFCYAEELTRLRHGNDIKWKGVSLNKKVNVCISALHLGHPHRSFPVYVIFAIENIAKGSPIMPQICLRNDETGGLCSPVLGWPQSEPYFHGIGRHTVGPPNVNYPLNMLVIRDCPHIGTGQKELVASEFIPKGTVFPYTGVPSDRSSSYSWYTSAGYNILGGGIMRYANIYFGFASCFNAVLIEIPFIMSGGSIHPILGVALLQDVQIGEPILVRSYGRDADFEILRRIVCNGNYLEMERFPGAMKIQGLDSNEQWYLPGDLVAVKIINSIGSITDIKLYSLCKLTASGAMGVQLKKMGGYGVEFMLMKGTKAERLKLKKCILLLPDDDYVITYQKGDNKKARHRNFLEHSNHTPESSNMDPINMILHSWQFRENRGPISDSALETAMTVERHSESKNHLRLKRSVDKKSLLTVRLSQSVFFLLFSCLEKTPKLYSLHASKPQSAIVLSGTRITQPHKMGSMAQNTKEEARNSIVLKEIPEPSLFDSFSRFLNEETSFL